MKPYDMENIYIYIMAKKDRETLLAKYEFHFLRDKEEIKDKRNEKYIISEIFYIEANILILHREM